MTYFFILGNNPTLSTAEIIARLGDSVQPSQLSAEALLCRSEEEIDLPSLQKQLGGTIKAGQIIDFYSFPWGKEQGKIRAKMKELLLGKKKTYFGFSVYHLEGSSLSPALLKSLAMKLKKELKENEVSSRWVTSKQSSLSSVIVRKNKLLDGGKEFVFLLTEQGFFLGYTVSCQDFALYEFYDYQRPRRPIERGMLPPKLAKIMINLSRAPKDKPILDPFCGSGTLIQEALLLGYGRVIGVDKNKAAMEKCRENIRWIRKQNPQMQSAQVDLFTVDVKNLSSRIQNNFVQVVVSEPYLGPLKIKSQQGKIEQIIEKLGQLYLTAFAQFKKIVAPTGKVCFIFPVFRLNGQLYFLPVLDRIKQQGWTVEQIIPDDLVKHPAIELTDRQSVIYSRPQQNVLREIFLFSKR